MIIWDIFLSWGDMCLAIPGLVESVEGRTAIIDFGGVKREAVIDLMEPDSIKPGVYVLVHTGFVIQIMDEKAALETLKTWRMVLSHMDKT
jgi:hydrogenase expression/formation protein HypC